MKRRILAVSICALAMAVSGCGSHKNWSKPGASSQDAQSARSKCEYQMRLQRTDPLNMSRLMDLCMQGEGYRADR